MLEAVVDTIIDADVARSNAMDPSAVAGALTDNARRGLVFEPPSSIALARSASVDDDGDDDATRGVFSLLSEDDMLAAVTAPQLPERIAVRCAPCRDAVARCAWWLTVLCWTLLVRVDVGAVAATACSRGLPLAWMPSLQRHLCRRTLLRCWRSRRHRDTATTPSVQRLQPRQPLTATTATPPWTQKVRRASAAPALAGSSLLRLRCVLSDESV
jgi:hypothetical protein